MALYTYHEKKQFIQQIKHLESLFGAAPLTNVILNNFNPDLIDTLAVGSLVYRKNGSSVLVRRRETPDEWIIPGGVVEAGEDILESVTREVKEETGLDSVVDGLLRIGLAIDYSPEQFREVNRKRFGKEAINLLFVNFRSAETSGVLDGSNDPSQNILEAKEFKSIPFDKITYVYRVLFVQQNLYDANLSEYPPVAFTPPFGTTY